MSQAKSYEQESTQYSGPYQREKLANTLIGILDGIRADEPLKDGEVQLLHRWCQQARRCDRADPFGLLVEALEPAVHARRLGYHVHAELSDICYQLTADSHRFVECTAEMQELQGMLAGVAADDRIEKRELERVEDWLRGHPEFKGCWPYDEIRSLVAGVLRDGQVDDDEHRFVLDYFREFGGLTPGLALEDQPLDVLRSGVCRVEPEIMFCNRGFCFTGQSSRGRRADLFEVIQQLDGLVHKDIRKTTDYLVIGDRGSRSWTYLSYGRKVEKAMHLRREGGSICIVRECDFWDAVEDEAA